MAISTVLLGRTDQAAIAITGMSAYRNGFEFIVTALLHPDGPGFDPENLDTLTLIHDRHKITLHLSDDSTITGGAPRGDSEPAGPILRSRGGSGTSHYQQTRMWSWPLPPSGPLTFICRWPYLGTSETQTTIDAQLILDAARQSTPLWPEHER